MAKQNHTPVQSTAFSHVSPRLGFMLAHTLRATELVCVVLLATSGAVTAYYAARYVVYFVGDLAWRWSKGYIYWEMHVSAGLFILAFAMLAPLFFILANALYRGRLSRRAGLWAIRVVVAGVVAFMIAFGLLLRSLFGFEDF